MDWRIFIRSKSTAHRPSIIEHQPSILVLKQQTLPVTKPNEATNVELITSEDNPNLRSILKKSRELPKLKKISFADRAGPTKDLVDVVNVKSFRYLNKLNTFHTSDLKKSKKCKCKCNFCNFQ